MDNSYIERYEIKNLQLEAQLQIEKRRVEHVNELKRNEEQSLRNSQIKFSEIKNRILLNRANESDPKLRLSSVSNLLEDLSKEVQVLRIRKEKVSKIETELNEKIKLLKKLETNKDINSHLINSSKLKRKLKQEAKHSEEICQARILIDAMASQFAKSSRSIKGELDECEVLKEGGLNKYDYLIGQFQEVQKSYEDDAGRGISDYSNIFEVASSIQVSNSSLENGAALSVNSDGKNNHQNNSSGNTSSDSSRSTLDNKELDKRNYYSKDNNSDPQVVEATSNSISFEFTNSAGHAFGIQIKGQGQQWVEVSIDPRERHDLSTLRNAKSEIIRALQAKGLKISALNLGNFSEVSSL